MRLFISIELPLSMREALAETQARLRESVKGRSVQPDSYHVTLAFMGDAPASSIDLLCEAIDDACCDFQPFNAKLGALGHFGKSDKAILWQGFVDDKPFQILAKRIRKNLDSYGIEYDSKSFKSHITLMRNADLRLDTLPPAVMESGTISTITLKKTTFVNGRANHEILYEKTFD